MRANGFKDKRDCNPTDTCVSFSNPPACKCIIWTSDQRNSIFQCSSGETNLSQGVACNLQLWRSSPTIHSPKLLRASRPLQVKCISVCNYSNKPGSVSNAKLTHFSRRNCESTFLHRKGFPNPTAEISPLPVKLSASLENIFLLNFPVFGADFIEVSSGSEGFVMEPTDIDWKCTKLSLRGLEKMLTCALW